jgi:glycosyltransferase involved in cell wall biosynthesis
VSTSNRWNIAIVLPIFNDWDAFAVMLEQIGKLPEIRDYDIQAIVVDDCSSEPADVEALSARKRKLAHIRIVRLACNLGPMRAIAVGLVVASRIPNIDAAIVMDADGEDRPDDLGRLISRP